MEKYDVILEKNENSYVFILDYGTTYEAICEVNKDDEVFVTLGTNYNEDYNERKEDIIKEFIVPIFGKVPTNIFIDPVLNISSAFEKAQEFYKKRIKDSKHEQDNFDNKISETVKKLKTEPMDFSLLKKELPKNVVVREKNKKVWNYTSYINKEAGTVSYYLYDDDVAILINNDGTFMPIIGINNMVLSKQDEQDRKEILEKFIFEELDVTINCDNNDKKNKELINFAIEHCSNSNIKYKDSEIIINTVGEKK